MGLFDCHDLNNHVITFSADLVSSVRYQAGESNFIERSIGAIVRSDGMDFAVVEHHTVVRGLWQGALTR